MLSETDKEIAVALDGVTKRYGTFTALDNVSLSIRDNEFFTLLGPSGCGKTTMLRAIAGFEDIQSGALRLFGKDIAGLPPNKRPVNTVFQNYALFPHMDVLTNVMFALKMLGKSDDAARKRAQEVLDLVQLTPFADRMPGQLSGGQQQRVALARALAPNPRVLLLDEPLSALDLKLRQAVRLELQQLQKNTGITFIFVTHDQEEALTMSDRIAVINAGAVQQVGDAREIYEEPNNAFVASFIGETNLISVDVQTVQDGQASVGLPGGETLVCALADGVTSGAGRLAIRPERVSICPVAGAALSGVVARVVYLGTDLQVAVTLPNDDLVTCRVQNRLGVSIPAVGETVGVQFDSAAARVLGARMAANISSSPSSVTTYQGFGIRMIMPAWVIIGFFLVLPVGMMLIYSFLTKEFRGGVIWEFSLAAYDQFFFDRGLFGDEAPSIEWTYITIFWRSIWQAGVATLLCLVIGFPTAWFIATRAGRARSLWLFAITIPYWVNLLIRTISMKFLIRDNGPLNEFLMAIGLINEPLHLINTNLAVQLGLFYSYLPFMVLPIYASVERYNFAYSEAAADLYASKWATLRRIILPIVKPGIIAGCILVFVPSLGAFLAPDLLGGAKNFMIGSLIEEQFKGNAGNWPFGAAASMILLSLVLIVLGLYARSQTKAQVR